MALPLEFFESFEMGTKGSFDSETDTGNRLDYPHAKDIAPVMPYRGAYCMRINLGKNSSDAYLEDGVSWPDQTSRSGRFRLFIGKDVQFGNDLDKACILQFYSSTSTKEARILLARIEPIGVCLVTQMEGDSWGFGSWLPHLKVPVDKWVTVEFEKWVDVAAGYISVKLTDIGTVASARFAEGTITKYRLGATDQTGDITGTIYFDDFAIDEDRLYEDHSAHNGALSGGSMLFVQSGFAFLGPGEIEHVSLIDGGSGDCRLKIYDTAEPTAKPLGGLRDSLATLTANATEQSHHRGFRVKRGAYVELSGTNPQAIVRLGHVDSDHISG